MEIGERIKVDTTRDHESGWKHAGEDAKKKEDLDQDGKSVCPKV